MTGTKTSGAGAFLRHGTSRTLLDGRLELVEWELDVGAPGFDSTMSTLIAASYLSNQTMLAHPEGALAAKLPAAGSTPRKGDFGELLAGVLYSHRIGYDVPFQRLERKPVAGATLQGSDLLALSLDHAEAPQPVVVEVKYRAKVDPGKHLLELTKSLANVDEEYLVSAWVSGVELMESYPDAKKAFALSAAQQLSHLVEPDEPSPPHERHAVMVVGSGKFTNDKVKEHWGTSPPVSHLHVITVPDLEATMDRLYNAAADLNYSDAASGVPSLISHRAHLPGIAAPVSSSEAVQLISSATPDDTIRIIEAALWLLADWDGMGVARARQVIVRDASSHAVGMAQILTGAAGRARTTLVNDPELAAFAVAVQKAWRLELDAKQFGSAAAAVVDALDGNAAEAVRYVAAAVGHRLGRHPVRLTQAAGATGQHVRHVVDDMVRFGKVAFWPSQAAAIDGGLLDAGQASLAIKMPTSAGKTTLIELVVADALDRSADAVVAVLAPTKALVSQLSADLHKALPSTSSVRSSHGGLDFDLDAPASTGILAEPGAAVMTPERFDLEWRRAASGDDYASIDEVGLIVVDEAHLLAETKRGARLELVISRALRRGIRVVLLSSQFPDPGTIAGWLGGKPIESAWTPTWLERFVYFTSDDKAAGMLQRESGDPEHLLTLSKKVPPGPNVCAPDRRTEAAALAETLATDGLVVLYSDKKSYIPKLVAAVDSRVGTAPPPPAADLEVIAAALDATEPEHSRLLRSRIGVHHADLPRAVRQSVETAARKGLLNYLICTSTLLEGVDFPTRSVVAVYPPERNGRAQVARLRNLAGRAGRAGLFTRGTLTVMVGDPTKVRKWLRAFRAELPSTPSALSAALERVRGYAQSIDLTLEDPADDDAALPTLDAVVLAAVIEGGVIDGDLRADLEEVLGRTLWWTNAIPAKRDHLLDLATRRAKLVTKTTGGDVWSRSFYRTGLPLASSLKIRDALTPHVSQIAARLDSAVSADRLLLWLASKVAPTANELVAWQAVEEQDLAGALGMWLAGDAVEDIEAKHPAAWGAIRSDLETLLPWVMTATIEYIATALDRPEIRDIGYQKLGIARLRYGVPQVELCEFVRRGEDRVVVTGYAAEFAKEDPLVRLTTDIQEYVEGALVAAAKEAAKEAADAAASAADEMGDVEAPAVDAPANDG